MSEENRSAPPSPDAEAVAAELDALAADRSVLWTTREAQEIMAEFAARLRALAPPDAGQADSDLPPRGSGTPRAVAEAICARMDVRVRTVDRKADAGEIETVVREALRQAWRETASERQRILAAERPTSEMAAWRAGASAAPPDAGAMECPTCAGLRHMAGTCSDSEWIEAEMRNDFSGRVTRRDGEGEIVDEWFFGPTEPIRTTLAAAISAAAGRSGS